MATLSSSGSPAARGRPSPFHIHEDSDNAQDGTGATRQKVCSPTPSESVLFTDAPQNTKHAVKHSEDLLPLASSKLVNTQAQSGERAASGIKVGHLTLHDSHGVLTTVDVEARSFHSCPDYSVYHRER